MPVAKLSFYRAPRQTESAETLTGNLPNLSSSWAA